MKNFVLLFVLLSSTLQHADAMALTRPATSTGGMEGLGRFMGTIEIDSPVDFDHSMTPDSNNLYNKTASNKTSRPQNQCLTNRRKSIYQNSSTEDSDVCYKRRPVIEINIKDQRINKLSKTNSNYSTPQIEEADKAVKQLMSEALYRTLSDKEIQASLDKYNKCLSAITFIESAEAFRQNETFYNVLIFLQQIEGLYNLDVLSYYFDI